MPDHCIIAVIGAAKAGKRTLISAVSERFTEGLSVLQVTTTRSPEPREDDTLFFRTMKPWRFNVLSAAGKLIDTVEHLGERYAYESSAIEDALRRGHLIGPMRETTVVALRKKGHTVFTVRVVARYRVGTEMESGAGDAFADVIKLRADMTVVNIRDHHGREMAVDHLAYLVNMWTGLLPSGQSPLACL